MRTSTALFAVLLLAGCNADRSPAPAAQVPATTTPAATAGDAATADAPQPGTATPNTALGKSYDCGSGVIVDILKDDLLRATVPGQPTIELQRIANSTPPVFTGGNLYFTVGQNGVYLSQEDGTELACQPR